MSDFLSPDRELTLLDLLDRILDKGVVIQGDIMLSVADVDLVYLGLRVILTSVDNIELMRGAHLNPPTTPRLE
ncbi:gas vesicle protein [Candidatus Oscillochloris fontis]|uniref:gas vesicle protein n=1 Tax=Candidatus Oscillochloris fontis TaxID=2496868 RepID=UPI00101CC70F|nr:gas vesicle protein [Candidatus Oscillochloris fontis]